MNLYAAAIEGCDQAKLAPHVPGGATRQDSVRLGLEALAGAGVSAVLIHDAARPFISADIIDRVIAALEGHSCVLAAEPVADTLKRAGEGGTVAETVDRNGLWRAQTPQAFRLRHHSRSARPRPRAPVATTSPTTPRSPNGPDCRSSSSRVRAATPRSRQQRISPWPTSCWDRRPWSRAPVRVSTCIASRPATPSGCAASRSLIPTARRAFRCRRRVACTHRRAAGRHRRRRHRPAFSAE